MEADVDEVFLCENDKIVLVGPDGEVEYSGTWLELQALSESLAHARQVDDEARRAVPVASDSQALARKKNQVPLHRGGCCVEVVFEEAFTKNSAREE
jgi:ribonuclease HI